MGDFWVFGYGSLIWRPGFEYLQEQKALLYGKHRSLCVHSYFHRGSPEAPGLVLGLDHGGSCQGLARLIESAKADVVIAYLRERELVTNVYKEQWVKLTLQDGRSVTALTYVVDRRHKQYAHINQLNKILDRVIDAKGHSGPNIEYVNNTILSLNKLGIKDRPLELIHKKLQEMQVNRLHAQP